MTDKNYFFRDLDDKKNRDGDRTIHHAGIAELFCNIGSPSESGKDVCVTYFNPFSGCVDYTWRSFDEIELFEVGEFDFNEAKALLIKIQGIAEAV